MTFWTWSWNWQFPTSIWRFESNHQISFISDLIPTCPLPILSLPCLPSICLTALNNTGCAPSNVRSNIRMAGKWQMWNAAEGSCPTIQSFLERAEENLESPKTDNGLVAKVLNTRNRKTVRKTATFCFRSIQPFWNGKWQLVTKSPLTYSCIKSTVDE
jgi:hypothetical protein